MRSAEQTKLDPSLRVRLIDAGELLFGRDGFSGVSLRQISAAAGTKNNFAVQYHFGDAVGLTRAILEIRAPILEIKRGETLARTTRDRALTTRSLLEVLSRPLIELVDANGNALTSRFMVALNATTWGWEPLTDVFEHMPVTQQLVRTLVELNPHLAPPVVWYRLSLVSGMILTCANNVAVSRNGDAFTNAVIDNVFDMAAAAIASPLDAAATEQLATLPSFFKRFSAGMP